MSRGFIPYTPDVEIVEPGFDENLQTVMARTERYITESVTAEGTGPAVRDAHVVVLVGRHVRLRDCVERDRKTGRHGRGRVTPARPARAVDLK